jgi:hypothetical protein
MGLVCVWAALRSILDSDSGPSAGALLALGLAVAAWLAPLFFLRGRRSWVSRFDAQGVTLQSGRRVAWNEFQGVRAVHGRVGQVIYYELAFRGAHARIFPAMVANAPEVLAVVTALQRGEPPFARLPR